MKWTKRTKGNSHSFLCSERWLLSASREDFFQSCPLPPPIIQAEFNLPEPLLSIPCREQRRTFTGRAGEGLRGQELLVPGGPAGQCFLLDGARRAQHNLRGWRWEEPSLPGPMLSSGSCPVLALCGTNSKLPALSGPLFQVNRFLTHGHLSVIFCHPSPS